MAVFTGLFEEFVCAHFGHGCPLFTLMVDSNDLAGCEKQPLTVPQSLTAPTSILICWKSNFVWIDLGDAPNLLR